MKIELYLATSKTSGKSYCGITSQGKAARWSQHCSDARRGSLFKFSRALRKYGAADFDLVVLASYLTREEAKHAEIQVIANLDLIKNGYNSTAGGDFSPMSDEEMRPQFLAALVARNKSRAGEKRPEAGLSISIALRGVKKTEVHAMAIKKAANRPDVLSKRIGKRASDATRDQMSQSATELWARRRATNAAFPTKSGLIRAFNTDNVYSFAGMM